MYGYDQEPRSRRLKSLLGLLNSYELEEEARLRGVSPEDLGQTMKLRRAITCALMGIPLTIAAGSFVVGRVDDARDAQVAAATATAADATRSVDIATRAYNSMNQEAFATRTAVAAQETQAAALDIKASGTATPTSAPTPETTATTESSATPTPSPNPTPTEAPTSTPAATATPESQNMLVTNESSASSSFMPVAPDEWPRVVSSVLSYPTEWGNPTEVLAAFWVDHLSNKVTTLTDMRLNILWDAYFQARSQGLGTTDEGATRTFLDDYFLNRVGETGTITFEEYGVVAGMLGLTNREPINPSRHPHINEHINPEIAQLTHDVAVKFVGTMDEIPPYSHWDLSFGFRGSTRGLVIALTVSQPE